MNALRLPGFSTWTVSEITHLIKDLFQSEEVLRDVTIAGEISNLSRPSSGHLYFTLKDNAASIRAVMWRTQASRLQIQIRDGDAVEAHGTIDVYEAGGQYQLYADRIVLAGAGALYEQFLRLKSELEAEGLFEIQKDKTIPERTKRVAIVTSPSGAALQDILNTLRRRYPLAEVILVPTPVQGAEAPPLICNAIRRADREEPDVIIIARGGGSVEDLWAFNDEQVVRTIAGCRSPVITGIGHDTDFTLADFASAVRAPTPTAAAELASPDRSEDLLFIDQLDGRLADLTRKTVERSRWQLERAAGRMEVVNPIQQIVWGLNQCGQISSRLGLAIENRMSILRATQNSAFLRLDSLNPENALNRGYAIIRADLDQRLITSRKGTIPGEHVHIQFKDGKVPAEILQVKDEVTNGKA